MGIRKLELSIWRGCPDCANTANFTGGGRRLALASSPYRQLEGSILSSYLPVGFFLTLLRLGRSRRPTKDGAVPCR